jgi:hypothetical protein
VARGAAALPGGELPTRGAIWLTYYPHIMVEWYPHVLTVSTLHPIGPEKTLNVVEFYYPEEIAAFEREFVEAQRAAYMETCIEDDEIGERMDAGRRALMLRGDNEVGPYQSPMEDGMQHFHEWYRRAMGLRPPPENYLSIAACAHHLRPGRFSFIKHHASRVDDRRLAVLRQHGRVHQVRLRRVRPAGGGVLPRRHQRGLHRLSGARAASACAPTCP